MNTIGFNQHFTLSFLISKREKENTKIQLNHRKFTIKEYPSAPAMLEVLLEVSGIRDAFDTVENLK